jgi:Fe/S biogenesis protein NfuA
MITISELARTKFLAAIEGEGRQGHGLRVAVTGGGTWRPEFALDFVGPEDARAGDTVIDLGPFKVYIDPESAKWLEGATVDYVEELHESGFKVDAPNAGIPRPTGPLAEAVTRVLEEKINPSVAAHGGWINLVALDGSTAYLRFGGGCQGCGMVNVTLKQGVEAVLFEDVPGLTKVMDVTDHAAGENPYYQPAK